MRRSDPGRCQENNKPTLRGRRGRSALPSSPCRGRGSEWSSTGRGTGRSCCSAWTGVPGRRWPTSSRSGCVTRSAPDASSAASGCPPPGRLPRSSVSRAGSWSTPMPSSSRRGTSGRRRARGRWSPRAAGTSGRPSGLAPRHRGSTWTSSTASPTCAASRCATGSGPWAWPGGPRPRPTSVTSSARGRPSCARCSPHTCAGCAERSSTRTRCSSAPGSGTASTSCSGPCSPRV